MVPAVPVVVVVDPVFVGLPVDRLAVFVGLVVVWLAVFVGLEVVWVAVFVGLVVVEDAELAEVLLAVPDDAEPLEAAAQLWMSGPLGCGALGPPVPHVRIPLPEASVAQKRSSSSMSTNAVIVVPPGELLNSW